MASIKRFEDFEAWKQARVLARVLYQYCRQQPLTKDYGLCDQLRRAAVSVMANIAEGFGRDGNKEFIQFLSTAKGSVTELKSHFYVMLDATYITETDFKKLYQQADYTEVLIARLMQYLQKSTFKGIKYKST